MDAHLEPLMLLLLSLSNAVEVMRVILCLTPFHLLSWKVYAFVHIAYALDKNNKHSRRKP